MVVLVSPLVRFQHPESPCSKTAAVRAAAATADAAAPARTTTAPLDRATAAAAFSAGQRPIVALVAMPTPCFFCEDSCSHYSSNRAAVFQRGNIYKAVG